MYSLPALYTCARFKKTTREFSFCFGHTRLELWRSVSMYTDKHCHTDATHSRACRYALVKLSKLLRVIAYSSK